MRFDCLLPLCTGETSIYTRSSYPEAVSTLHCALENGADLHVNEHQKIRHSGGFRICERVVPTSGAQSAPGKIWVTTPIFAVNPRPFPVF